MYDLMAMAVLDGTYNLLEELASLVVVAFSTADQVVEQFPLRILQHHDNIRLRGNHRVSADQIRRLAGALYDKPLPPKQVWKPTV